LAERQASYHCMISTVRATGILQERYQL